jgi:TetR/AcrR family transcriptional regulator, cholesterol catabolism regulator
VSIQPSEDRVLRAAAQEFADAGYASATVRRIADRCGMSPGSLFNRYATKRELLVATVAEGTVLTDTHARSRLEGVTGPLERLRTLVVAHLETLLGDANPFTVVAMREMAGLDDDERARVTRHRDRYERLWQDVIDDAVAAGLLSDDPLVRLFLLGAVNHTPLWYRPEAGLTIQELGSRFVDLAVSGGPAGLVPGARADRGGRS